MVGFKTHVFDYFNEAKDLTRGMCISASLDGDEGTRKKSDSVVLFPTPYVCPICHKVDFYLTDREYQRAEYAINGFLRGDSREEK